MARADRAKLFQWIGLAAGPILAVIVYLVLQDAQGLSDTGARAAAIAVLIVVFWMTEALPLPATSLLPIVLFPLFGILPLDGAATPYANPFIFLFMGGYMIALAMERWNLHKRIALVTVRIIGTKPAAIILGFMVATAFLSMWISNTATTVAMLPVGISIIALVMDKLRTEPGGTEAANNLAVSLMLGIAYSATIGGTMTLVGTVPNVYMASFMENQFGLKLSFAGWMLIGVPMGLLMLAIVWLLMTKVIFPMRIKEIPGGRALIQEETTKLGPMSIGEKLALMVFIGTAVSWLIRVPLQNLVSSPADGSAFWLDGTLLQELILALDDTIIALTAALLMFVIPVDVKRRVMLLDWSSAVKLPWGVLLLFGGGLALAKAVRESKLDQWIGENLEFLSAVPEVLLVLFIVALMVFLTEVTSNTATTTTFLPILAGLGDGLNLNPITVLIPVAIAVNYAFMMPVATPPNATVFGTGYIRIGQMIRAGLWLNLIGIALVTLATFTLIDWVMSMEVMRNLGLGNEVDAALIPESQTPN